MPRVPFDALPAHGRGEGDRRGRRDRLRLEHPGDREDGRQAAGVVGDARTPQEVALAPHPQVRTGREDGVQVGREVVTVR